MRRLLISRSIKIHLKNLILSYDPCAAITEVRFSTFLIGLLKCPNTCLFFQYSDDVRNEFAFFNIEEYFDLQPTCCLLKLHW